MTHLALDPLAWLKLGLGLAAFLLIAYFGNACGKRVSGLLLTFPILNGIALLTSSDPFRAASAIYVVVIFNCLLFWIVITWVDRLPPARSASEFLLGIDRLLCWIVLWMPGAYLLIAYRDALPSGPVLFGVQSVLVALSVFAWRPPAPTAAASAPTWLSWLLNWAMRITLFVVVFGILQATARTATDEKWVGMASALPLPGLFALAYLSTRNSREGLRPIRDTVLIGPLLVIPFNYLYASAITAYPAWAIPILLAIWAIGLLLVFRLVPALERTLDEWRRVQ